MKFVAFKGPTAYEFQMGRFWARLVHLRGGHWSRFFVSGRFGMGWFR